MTKKEKIQEVLECLSLIEQDNTVPKNIRSKIKGMMALLNDNTENINLLIDRSLEEFGEIAEDPNIPSYTRMQIWGVVSLLESKE